MYIELCTLDEHKDTLADRAYKRSTLDASVCLLVQPKHLSCNQNMLANKASCLVQLNVRDSYSVHWACLLRIESSAVNATVLTVQSCSMSNELVGIVVLQGLNLV